MKSKEIFVDQATVVKALRAYRNEPTDQIMLRILKDRGAPVVGTVLLRFEKGYTWRHMQDRVKQGYWFQWWKE